MTAIPEFPQLVKRTAAKASVTKEVKREIMRNGVKRDS